MAFLFLAPRVAMWAARTPVGRRVISQTTRAVSNTLRQHHLMPRIPQLPRILPRVHIPTPRLPPGLTHAAHVVRTQANAVQHAATAAARAQARRAGARILQTAHRIEHAHDRVQHAQDAHAALVGHAHPGPAPSNAAPPTPLDVTGPASTQGQPAPLPVPDPGDSPAHSIEPTRVYNQDHSKDLPPETHQHTDPHTEPPAPPSSGLSTPVIALAVVGGGAALFYLLRSPKPAVAT